MKKLLVITGIFVNCLNSACTNENSKTNTSSVEENTSAETDSSTTNPINSEYGTPNASENAVDSAQSVKKDSARK